MNNLPVSIQSSVLHHIIERVESGDLDAINSLAATGFSPEQIDKLRRLPIAELVRLISEDNPLDYVSMTRHLLFFDGRDKAQIKQAENLIEHYQGRLKPILTAGSYVQLMRQWKAQVYYDQGGALVRKFGIEHVPALVSQEGKRLRIDEVI